MFGLREWSSDPELAVLVASEKDDPFFKPGHVGPVRRRSEDAASDESDASRDDRTFHPPTSSHDEDLKTKRISRKGKRTRLENTVCSSDDEEGLRLLLDAAVGMNGEAEARAGSEEKDQDATKNANPSKTDPDPSIDATEKTRKLETEKEKAAALWGDVSLHASAPPSASDTAAAEQRRRHLDGVVQTLSARCAELYVLLGPHQIVARELAVLIVALRGGGARYALQEKVVTEQLWELARALAFPGGLGETPETRAALARIVAASVEEAATVASASIAEAAAMSAHREQVERSVEAQVEAHANAARILAATTMRTGGVEGGGGTAGDATAASRLLAGARSALDGGATVSASAYAALAAASAAADTSAKRE